MIGSKTIDVQQTQEQNGEHKSYMPWLSVSEFWEIDVNWSELITASSSQGNAENVIVKIDNMIAINFIKLVKGKKTLNATVLHFHKIKIARQTIYFSFISK